MALLLVHLTYNLSCIKYAHISQQVHGLCISSSSIQAHRMKPSILRQMQSWFRMEKTTEAAIGYNVLVANNNFRYNLRLPWRKKKKKKRNPSQFITRIASHPRNYSPQAREYWWIFPETKSRGIFTNIRLMAGILDFVSGNIHQYSRAWEPERNNCFSIITQVIIEIHIKQRNVKFYHNLPLLIRVHTTLLASTCHAMPF